MERMEPFIDAFTLVVTNISIIYVIYSYIFGWDDQIIMLRFIKGKVDTENNIMKVIVLNM